MKDACSIESSGAKSWVVGAVTQSVPKHVRSRVNRCEKLVREEDDEDEEDEVCSIPSLEESSDAAHEIVYPVDEGSDDED
eukprot:11264524-Karenia_brevis.AAC.1